MAFFWVQQWVALPVVYEQQMGDLPPGSRPQAMDNTNTDLVLGGNNSAASSTTFKSPDNYQPFYSQFSAIPQGHPRSDFRSPTHPSAHYHPQEHASSPLNMGAIAGALPDYATSDDSSLNTIPQSVPRTLPGASPSAVAYQHGQNMHMSAHASGSVPLHPSYGSGFPLGPYQPNIMPSHSAQHASYSVYGANHSRQGGPTPIQAPYQGYVHTPQYMYYPAPYGSQAQFSPAFIPQGPQAQTMYGRRASLNNSVPGLSGHMMDYTHTESAFAGLRVGQGSFKGDPNLAGQSLGVSYVHASGESIFFLKTSVLSYSRVWVFTDNDNRPTSLRFGQLNTSRSTSQAEAVWTCPLGWQFTSWNDSDGAERSFLARCYSRH